MPPEFRRCLTAIKVKIVSGVSIDTMINKTKLQDRFGRRVEYLRLSVTDRCDLRCTYCIPEGFHGFEEPSHWLSHDELVRVVGAFTRMGVNKVRLTGGEPLLRRDITQLSQRLGALPGIRDLSLSTNCFG